MITRQPHHDGSELYVSSQAPNIGQRVNFKIRCPQEFRLDHAYIRIFHDGEPRAFAMKKIGKKKSDIWWSVSVPIINPSTHYRFLLVSKENYMWLNGMGVHNGDVTDREDFQILAIPGPPSWIRSSVFYQIFPDRFATSGSQKNLPDWAIARDWNSLPRGRDKTTGQEFYGGDFDGIASKIPYICALGVNAIYFTPTFPSRSNHRYDASSFDEIDPLLGGDIAFLRFLKAARKEKLRILSDLTTNHCGAGHRWIRRALDDPKATEREFFYWDKKIKHGYVGWWGLASLPKLNYNSKKLRALMYEGKKSVVQKWLSAPYKLDGWRIDVGNMTGRLAADDLHDEVMRGIRAAIDDLGNDYWLVAENGDFLASDLDGFGWHGAMNYQGFLRPVWNWLHTNTKIGGGFQGLPFSMPNFSGNQLVDSMSEFSAAVPWDSFTSCMLLLDSHDTARMRTVVNGDHNRHLSGMALALTYPGVPSIYAGDEIGLEGDNGEAGRRTIPWDAKNHWDSTFLDSVKQLVALRRTQPALSDGGLRWIEITDDYLLFARESKQQSLIVFISRNGVEVELDLAPFGFTITKTLYGASQIGNTLKITAQAATAGIWQIL